MKSKNAYEHPLKDKDILREFTKEPPSPKIHISKEGEVKNVPGHKRFVGEDGSLTDLTNAVDFLCKEGTPIKAAKEGKVFDVYTRCNENYSGIIPPTKKVLPEEKQDGNYVVIEHPNKEYSIYSHLKSDGIVVTKGQEVKAGDVLGYSGNTGWSIEPHLHFMVFKLDKKGLKRYLKSLEINWKK
ncbi:MAG: M23 family metallopeptidase [Candidatus Nanoarchaeia archaeon]|nr:M23 family metallopeptidase [Candidatus Nanoarchaeia archaeon]